MTEDGKKFQTRPRALRGPAWQRLRRRVLRRDGYVCRLCGATLLDDRESPRGATVDHIAPRALAADQARALDNLASVCRQCHDSTCQRLESLHWPNVDAICRAKRDAMASRIRFDAAGRVI